MDGETDPAGTSYGEEDDEMQEEAEAEPALTQAERERRKERLHERLKVAVIQVVENEVNTQTEYQFSVSPVVLSALAELTSKYAESLARDLEAFAYHAGRKTVNVEDVLLAARKNPDVRSSLADFAKQLGKPSDQQQPKKRKRLAGKVLPDG